MNRAFISLYVFIVASVLTIGWTTEQVWQAISASPEISRERKALMRILAVSIDEADHVQAERELSLMQSQVDNRLLLYVWDDFAESAIKQLLNAGDLIAISKEDGSSIYYQRSPSGRYIVGFVEQHAEALDVWLYRLLLISFYFLVGVSVYFWVLPLTRDLKKLQEKTDKVGRDGEIDALSLKPNSAIYSLAQTFNTMASRIRGLLTSQQEMTHGMSHELRTPLARMKFSLASISEPIREQANVKELEENVREMENLISQFLNYASFEEKKGDVQFREGELEPMIIRVVDHSDIHVPVTISNELNSTKVFCEWDLLEHCIKNLLQNASRYAAERIQIYLRESATHYQICVEDDGPGVSPEDRERVFQAFYRSGVNAKIENKVQGGAQALAHGEKKNFGLGLALVRRIMRWHHGDVNIKEASLGGASFVLSWRKPQ